MSAEERFLITGASGFLGRAVVAAARSAGVPVVAMAHSKGAESLWADDAGVTVKWLDLAGLGAAKELLPLLGDVTAVIHAAARMHGTDAEQARDTVAATEAVAAALAALPTEKARPRFLLASSFAVYGYAAMPGGATLDERTPAEPDLGLRDAYCRAKLAQEAVAIRAAQASGLLVALMRIGALYGPGHMWTSRLGFSFGGRVFCPGGNARVPAIHVDDCAAALVSAARQARVLLQSDIPMPNAAGHVEVVNLVAPNAPTQRDWLRAAGKGRVIGLPLGLLLRCAKLADLASAILPPLRRLQPAGLHEATLAARFKPLLYSAARAEDRLGFVARPFPDGAAASLQDSL